MTRYKNDFEKLSPAEQVAINFLAEKAKSEEFIEAYKESKAKETLKKKPMNAGEVIFLILIIGLALVIFFLPMIQMEAYTSALRSAGPAICHAQNSTYISAEFRSLTDVKIICTDLTIKLP
jgi:hypothetical protein